MYDAMVLAGGAARRIGGLDKPGLEIGGVSLLDRVLQACATAERTVVVGPARPTYRPVVWRREEPPGGGPLAALAAGLPEIEADLVVVLAADLPFVSAQSVAVLTAALPPEVDGRLVVDRARPQWLAGCWRTDSLRTALSGVPAAGASMGSVLGTLAVEPLSFGESWLDVDTEQDLVRARERAAGR